MYDMLNTFTEWISLFQLFVYMSFMHLFWHLFWQVICQEVTNNLLSFASTSATFTDFINYLAPTTVDE